MEQTHRQGTGRSPRAPISYSASLDSSRSRSPAGSSTLLIRPVILICSPQKRQKAGNPQYGISLGREAGLRATTRAALEQG